MENYCGEKARCGFGRLKSLKQSCISHETNSILIQNLNFVILQACLKEILWELQKKEFCFIARASGTKRWNNSSPTREVSSEPPYFGFETSTAVDLLPVRKAPK